jgi:hypothetical protein
MVDINFGMERGELKAMLAKSKADPINCAIGRGTATAYLQMHKTKQPRKLSDELVKQFGDLKDPRWGTCYVDPDDDPKRVNFRINRPASGLAKRITKIVKLVGYSKVRFEFDDGSEAEEDSEEELEETATTGQTGETVQEQPTAQSLSPRLSAAAQRIAAALKLDPSRKDTLIKLAQDAQGRIGANDYQGALAGIIALETAIDAPAPQRSSAPQDTGGTAGAVAYAKSRLAWIAVRRTLETEVDKLRVKMLNFYKQRGVDIGVALNRSFNERVREVMAALDDELLDILDEATNESDPSKRAALVANARDVIKRYQTFITSESLLSELDDNPFEKLNIKATVTKTLETLSSALR